MEFPPFDLARLLTTVFDLRGEERFGVFTDLPDLAEARDLAFLTNPARPIQRHAYETFFRGLKRLQRPMRAGEVSFHIYETTGGSNLDLPESVSGLDGKTRTLRSVLEDLDIVLYVSTFSATAPITKLAKEMGFRGATLHGVNDTILATGLAVDYTQVSARAERLRKAMEGADSFAMEFRTHGETFRLDLDVSGVEAQKSHGLVRTPGDIANLPAGEVYFVPRDARGRFPQKLDDGTLVVLDVEGRGIVRASKLLAGDKKSVDRYLAVIASDPNAGQITELGLGTQSLPFAGADIQDEKIIGTAHVATGRSDHLGGTIDSSSFKNPRNASHNDILFAPIKTPEITLARVSFRRGGREEEVVRDYRPTPFIERLL